MNDRLAMQALELTHNPAWREAMKRVGDGLQAEILAFGPKDERGIEAWYEYQGFKRLIARLDQMGSDAVKEDGTNG